MTIFWRPTGALIKYERSMLHIEALNPEIKTKWHMSRGEMLRVGWRFIYAALATVNTMTDLVERLHTYLASELDTSDDAARERDTMIAEAADQIERLRQDTNVLHADICAENDNMKAEIERLRGIIYRNCDWRKAAILSSDEDAAAIRKICDADEAP